MAAFAICGMLLGPGVARAVENNDTEVAEVLTRGPVHEAFAGAVSYNAEPGIIVATKPPEMIDEVPPEQKPEGDNVAWIPGYWAWDEDQNDYLWISGIWRNLPPGREWVPGYWGQTGSSYQWTSGYWQDAEAEDVSYLPQPPKSLEMGPNVEAPSEDYNWIPGNWVWNDSSYAWRAGYWAGVRENWLWTPACYRWTHRGYIYVDGYWDYGVANRGVLFAPVHFQRDYYSRPGYYYTPSTVINLSVFTDHLFLRPNYCHYYFGDYYAPRYRSSGYYSSFFYNYSRRGCDPIYAHYRWENRHNGNWERGRREYYEYRRDNENARPPRTWDSRPDRDDGRDGSRGSMAQRYDRFVSDRGDGRTRFQTVAKDERDRMVSQRQQIREVSKNRQQVESRGTRTPDQRDQVARNESRRSPIVGRTSDRAGDVPPRRLESSRPEQVARNSSGLNRPGMVARPQGQEQGRASRPEAGRQAVPNPNRLADNQPRRNADNPQSRQSTSPGRSAVPAPNRNLSPRSATGQTGRNQNVVPAPANRQQQPGGRQVAQSTPRTGESRNATPAQRPNVTRPQNQQPQRSAAPAPQQRPQAQRIQPAQRPQVQPQQRPQMQRSQPQQQRPQVQRSQPQQQRPQIQRSQPQQIQRSQPQRSQPQRSQQQRSQPRAQQR